MENFLFGLLLGGPAWLLGLAAFVYLGEGLDKLKTWWRWSPPEREAARRSRKREQLTRKLEKL